MSRLTAQPPQHQCPVWAHRNQCPVRAHRTPRRL